MTNPTLFSASSGMGSVMTADRQADVSVKVVHGHRWGSFTENEDSVTGNSAPVFPNHQSLHWRNLTDHLTHAKEFLLSNFWRCQCRHVVTITAFTGSVVGGDLVLPRLCSACCGNVASAIEMG